MDTKIEVKGLKELNSAFRKIDVELKNEMKSGFKGIAEKVASKIRTKVPRRKGKAASSVKARGTAKGGSVAAGGTAAPHYPWLDFGGSTGRGHQPGRAGSGAIKRTMPQGGRYIYPTIAEESESIKKDTDDLVEKVVRKAGFDQKGGE